MKELRYCKADKNDTAGGWIDLVKVREEVHEEIIELIEMMIDEQHYNEAMPDIGINEPFEQCPMAGGNICSCTDLRDLIEAINKLEQMKT